MKTLNLTLLVLAALNISGCGKAPLKNAPVQDATSTQVFPYNQFTQICSALKAWNPVLTNVQFPNDPGSLSIYFFGAAGIRQNGSLVTTGVVDVGSYPFTCVVTISNGSITSIQ